MSALARRDLTVAGVVVLGCVGIGGAASLSITLTGELGVFFGLSFVLLSVTCALSADIRALFAPGLLPPLMMVGALAVVAHTFPDAITVETLAETAGATQRLIAGVVDHAAALALGHLLALAVIGLRMTTARSHRSRYRVRNG